MLTQLRKHAGGWVAKLFIALLVLSFAIWGISDIFRGFGASTVARVGGAEIGVVDFQRAYQRELQRFGSQMQQPLTPDQARLIGLPGQVLGRLVAETALEHQADQFGVGVSDEMLAKDIRADAAFRGFTGTFDRTQFLAVLRANGYTEETYLRDRRAATLREQLAAGVTGGLTVPETYGEAVARFRDEHRSIRYLVLEPSLAGEVEPPSDEALQTYFEANKSKWRAPEYRGLTVLKVEPSDIADATTVSDEDAKAEYDARIDRYTTPERRHVRQIVFPDQAEADAAVERLAKGETFDAVVASRSLKPEDVELGTVSRNELIDPAVAEAVFALAEPGTTAVVAGRFGPVIAQVAEIQAGSVQPFDEVKDAIKKEIADSRASAEVLDLHDRIEDARAGGATLAEIGQQMKLPVREVAPISRNGTTGDDTRITDLPGGQELIAAAFQSDVGLENDPLQYGSNGFAWYDVTEIVPARDKTLDEVRDAVVADWTASQIADRLREKADAIAERLRKGEALDAVAAELSVPVKSAADLSRGGTPPEGLNQAAVQVAFDGPKGLVTAVPIEPAGARAVIVVDAVTVPKDGGTPLTAQARDTLSRTLGNQILDEYVATLQSEMGVAVNQALLQQAIGVTGP